MTTTDIIFVTAYFLFFLFLLEGVIRLSLDYKDYSKKEFRAQVASYVLLLAFIMGFIVYIVYGS